MVVYSSEVEGQHVGEFIIGEVITGGDIARETATLTSGQNVTDGTIVGLSSGKLIALTGEVDTAGDVGGVAVEGIIIGDWDASATGENADITGVPYIKQMAVVDDSLLVYPTETTAGGQAAAVQTQLAAKFIVRR